MQSPRWLGRPQDHEGEYGKDSRAGGQPSAAQGHGAIGVFENDATLTDEYVIRSRGGC
jgi:hypothetical protein